MDLLSVTPPMILLSISRYFWQSKMVTNVAFGEICPREMNLSWELHLDSGV